MERNRLVKKKVPKRKCIKSKGFERYDNKMESSLNPKRWQSVTLREFFPMEFFNNKKVVSCFATHKRDEGVVNDSPQKESHS